MGKKLAETFVDLLKLCDISKVRSIGCYGDLVKVYNTRRRYHNMSHIGYMLNYWRISENFDYAHAEQEALVALAIFYHDFVNEGNENDEKASCAVLKDIGLSTSLRAELEKLIMATKHGALPEEMSLDMKLIHDLDLAILGDTVNYGHYAANIRWEYSKYDDKAYKKGRIEVLTKLLSSQPLFLLPKFAELFEEDARSNMQKEIAYWQSR